MKHEDSRHRLLTFTATIISLIAVVFVLRTLSNIFVPLILAIFFAYLFAPAVEFLAKFKIPRIVTLIILLGVISVVGIFFTQMLANNIRAFIVYWPTMESKLLSGIRSFFNNYFGIETKSVLQILQSARVTEFLSNFLNVSMNVIGQMMLTLLILVFIYLTYNNYPRLVRKAFNAKRAQYLFEIVKNINVQIMNYILIKTLMSAGTGILTGVACALFGIKFAVLWGFLAFLFNFIPYIGSPAAVVLPIILSVLQFPGSYLPVFAALSLIVIQITIGSYLDPEMMGNRFNLSPILIILSLFFWGYVWGLVGAFLAVPITAVIKIITQNIEPLKPVAVLMSKKAD